MSRFSTLQLALALGLVTANAQFATAQGQGFSSGFQSTIPGYRLGQASGYSRGAYGGQVLTGGYDSQFSGGGYGGQSSSGGYGGQVSGDRFGGQVFGGYGAQCLAGGHGGQCSGGGCGGQLDVPAQSFLGEAGCSECGPTACGAAALFLPPIVGYALGNIHAKAHALCSGCCSRGCDMPQHYMYYPPMHGYYYFHPYHHSHIPAHQGIAARSGIDPRNPYSNDFFKVIYAEYRASQRDTSPEVVPEVLPAPHGHSVLPTPARP